MASNSNSNSRSGKPSLLTVLPIPARNDVDSLRRYMEGSSSSSDFTQAQMHLVFCGWRVKENPSGIFYVSPENDVTAKLIEACRIKLEKKPERKVQEEEDQEELRIERLCLLCNDGYTDDILQTGFCSPQCHIFSMYMEPLLWRPVKLSEDVDWLLMRSERNLVKSDQNQVLKDAAKILEAEFGPLLTDRLIFHENYYVAAVFKEKEMASAVTFKLHPKATNVFAQLPLAATHTNQRRKGALMALMTQLEKVLKQLNVNKIILPSLSQTLYIWVKNFGFATIPSWELYTFLEENSTIEDFPGTVLCYKILF